MSKVLAALISGLFAAGAFAQTPAAPAAAPAAPAKAEAKPEAKAEKKEEKKLIRRLKRKPRKRLRRKKKPRSNFWSSRLKPALRGLFFGRSPMMRLQEST